MTKVKKEARLGSRRKGLQTLWDEFPTFVCFLTLFFALNQMFYVHE